MQFWNHISFLNVYMAKNSETKDTYLNNKNMIPMRRLRSERTPKSTSVVHSECLDGCFTAFSAVTPADKLHRLLIVDYFYFRLFA